MVYFFHKEKGFAFEEMLQKQHEEESIMENTRSEGLNYAPKGKPNPVVEKR